MLNGGNSAAAAAANGRQHSAATAASTVSSNPLSVSMDNLSRLQQAAIACQLDARTLTQVFGTANVTATISQPHLPHSLQRSRSQQTATISVTTKEKLKEMLLSRQRLRSNESTDDDNIQEQSSVGKVRKRASVNRESFEPYQRKSTTPRTPRLADTTSAASGATAALVGGDTPLWHSLDSDVSAFNLRKFASEPNLLMRQIMSTNRVMANVSQPTASNTWGGHMAESTSSGTRMSVGENSVQLAPSMPNLGTMAPTDTGDLWSQAAVLNQYVQQQQQMSIQQQLQHVLMQSQLQQQQQQPLFKWVEGVHLPGMCMRSLLPQQLLDAYRQMALHGAQQLAGGTDMYTALAGQQLASSSSSAQSQPVQLLSARTAGSSGHSSLLKQQLRDLVLRRKSLVPEEQEQQIEDACAKLSVERRQSTSSSSKSSLNNDVQLKTGIAYDAQMCKHECLCGQSSQLHIEHGGRTQSIWNRLQERGLLSHCERIHVKRAPIDWLRLAHTQTYTTFFGISPTACIKLDTRELPVRSFVQLGCGGIGVDADTYFNDSTTATACRLAVGCAVELCTKVCNGSVRNGFAIVRPPGHHAESDQALGFCYFNNVAIAVKHCMQRQLAQRVAIVDWDVHHGNGTQEAFDSDPNVLYVSLHRHDNGLCDNVWRRMLSAGNFFPGTGAVTEIGAASARGSMVNVPFSGGAMGNAEYLLAWRLVVEPVLAEFAPDLIVVSAGFDAAVGHSDALGGYMLTPAIYAYFTQRLMRYAHGKLVLCLEGGYELSALTDSAEQCVAALCELPIASLEHTQTRANAAAVETVQKVIAVQKRYWKCLNVSDGHTVNEPLTLQDIDHDVLILLTHYEHERIYATASRTGTS